MNFALGLLLTVFAPIALGAWAAAPFHGFIGAAGFLAAGSVFGLTLFPAVAFLLALHWGMSWVTIILSLGILGACCAGLRHLGKHLQAQRQMSMGPATPVERWLIGIGLALLAAVIVASFSQVIVQKPDSVCIGFEKNLGDLPLHLQYIASFAFADNFPPHAMPDAPMYAGVPLRYPYLCDFYSALIWFSTGSMEGSVEWPGMVLGLALLVLLYQWTVRLTDSRLGGLLVCTVFFLGGSMGWVEWLREWPRLSFDLLPHSYTMIDDKQYRWPNVIYALLIPQRGLQFAFAQTILFWVILWDAAFLKDWRRFLFLGVFAASLPFYHGHATIVWAISATTIFCFVPSSAWFVMGGVIAVTWLPQMLFFAQKLGPKIPGGAAMIHTALGWEVQKGQSFGMFWLKNSGIFIPLVLVGAWVCKRREIRVMALAAAILFALGNVVMFAPWSWDNIKILEFARLLALPAAVAALLWMIGKRPLLLAPIAALLVMSLILAGILDLTRAIRPNSEDHREFSNYEVKLAAWLRENTPKRAIFLVAPSYNSPIVLTGRSVVLGYPGHIWSHGLPLQAREQDVRIMSKGEEHAAELFKHYGVTYVMLGWREREAGFRPEFFDQSGLFETLWTAPQGAGSDRTTIYRLRETALRSSDESSKMPAP